MDGLRYQSVPGAAWLVLVRGPRVVLLPAETSQQRLDEVWASLQGSASLEDVFDAVTGGLAGSLSALPSFGLISVDGQVNVLLRGDLELEVDGSPAASGRNLRTWSEQVYPASGRLVLRSSASDRTAAGPVLFLREGMAAVQGIEITLGAVAGPGTESRPAPAVRSAPAEPAAPVVHAEPVDRAHPAEPAEAESLEPAVGEDAPAAVSGPDLSAAIPWLNLTPPPLSPETALPEDEESQSVPDSGEPTETLPPVDHDGNTVMGFRPQPGTALPGTPLPGAPAPDSAAPAGPEDDDGETIRSAPAPGASVPAAGPIPAAGPVPATGPVPGTDTGPTVLARTCPQGHINPPTASACRSCGAELSGEPRPVSRPSLGLMRLSTGAVYELDRNIVIGRQPSASRVAGAALPRMVQVPSDSGDISRSHAEVRLEGWHVMLRDLFSTNGTVLIREGSLPRRLAQGEAAILLDGDIAELGDGVTLRFEGLA
ncbi:FHA domain-containing protein [Arthrobacter sp. NPDC055585]